MTLIYVILYNPINNMLFSETERQQKIGSYNWCYDKRDFYDRNKKGLFHTFRVKNDHIYCCTFMLFNAIYIVKAIVKEFLIQTTNKPDLHSFNRLQVLFSGAMRKWALYNILDF